MTVPDESGYFYSQKAKYFDTGLHCVALLCVNTVALVYHLVIDMWHSNNCYHEL